jgi:hypothetical protein
MSKNVKHGNMSAGVTLALAVPADTTAGIIVPIGSDGLLGYTITPRATTALIAAGTAAPGLADGQASVRLIGVDFTIEATIAGEGWALGDAVYTDGEGVFAASGAYLAGYLVSAIAGGKGLIAVTNVIPAGS